MTTASPVQRTAMSRAQLEARAIQRAHDEHVYIRRTERAHVYTTCSKSEPGVKHTLIADGDIIGCSCKGYEHRQSCKHAEALKNRLAREAAKPAPQPAATPNQRAIALLYPDTSI